MVIYMFKILIVSCGAVVLIGILFRIAGTLRLSIPLLYALVVAFFFPGGFMVDFIRLLAVCVVSINATF